MRAVASYDHLWSALEGLKYSTMPPDNASSRYLFCSPDAQPPTSAPCPPQVPAGPPTPRPSRISGTALPGGVHLSNGVYGTAHSLHLLLGGAYIISLGALAMALTYLEAWLLEQVTGLPLTGMLLSLTVQMDHGNFRVWEAAITILPFVNFILLLRLSTMSGYHAAEHKVVTAIEHFGYPRYQDVVEMPRVHPRCGTVLLFGLIPAMLLAYPMWYVHPTAAILVALLGWHFRYHTGYFVQNYFTTKPPTHKQLMAGIRAGQTLLERWQQDPARQVPWLRSIWIRGIPQMLIGLYLAQQVWGYVYANAHVWLDF